MSAASGSLEIDGVVAAEVHSFEQAPLIAPVPAVHVEERSPDHGELRQQVRSGLGWSLVNSLASRVFSVAIGLVMARLLVPEDYGVFAVGLVVLGVLQSANELGTSVALVRWPGDARRASQTAITIALGFSFVLYAVTFAAAPWIADALGVPSATTVLRLLGLCVIIDGFTTIPDAMVAREFLQKRRAIVTFAGILASSAVSVSLAATDHGPMSLVWGSLTGSLISAVAVYAIAPYRPRPSFRWSDGKELLRVGLPLGATSLIFLAVLNVDYVVVGRQLGAAQLGFYLLAFNLSMWPSNLLSVAVRRVAIPGFSRVQDDRQALADAFGRAFGLLTAVAGVAVVVLGLLSHSVIAVLYGDEWAPSAQALTWLAALGLCRVLIDLSYDLMVAIGRSGRLLLLQVAWFGLLVIALPIGADHGIEGVAVAHVIVAAGIILPAFLLVLRAAGISLRPVLRELRRPLVAGAAAVCVVALGEQFDLGDATRLFLVGGVATAVFLLIAIPVGQARQWLAARGGTAPGITT